MSIQTEGRVFQEFDLAVRSDISKDQREQRSGISTYKGNDFCHFFAKLLGQSIDIGEPGKPVFVHKKSLELFLSRNLGHRVDTSNPHAIQAALKEVKEKKNRAPAEMKGPVSLAGEKLGKDVKLDKDLTATRDNVFSFLTKVQQASGLKFADNDMKKFFTEKMKGSDQITITGAEFAQMVKNAKQSGPGATSALSQEEKNYITAILDLRKEPINNVIKNIEKNEEKQELQIISITAEQTNKSKTTTTQPIRQSVHVPHSDEKSMTIHHPEQKKTSTPTRAASGTELGVKLPEGMIYLSNEVINKLSEGFSGKSLAFVQDSLKSSSWQEGPVSEQVIFKHFFDNGIKVNSNAPKNMDVTVKHLADEFKKFSYMEININADTVSANKAGFTAFAKSLGANSNQVSQMWDDLSKDGAIEATIKDVKKAFKGRMGEKTEAYKKAFSAPEVTTDRKELPKQHQKVETKQLIEWSSKPESIPENMPLVVAARSLGDMLSQQPQLDVFSPQQNQLSRLPDTFMTFDKFSLGAFLEEVKTPELQPRAQSKILAICYEVEQPRVEEVVEEIEPQPVVEQRKASPQASPEKIPTLADLKVPTWGDKDVPSQKVRDGHWKTLAAECGSENFSIKADKDEGDKLHTVVELLNKKHTKQTKHTQTEKQAREDSNKMWNNLSKLSLFQQFQLYDIALSGLAEKDARITTNKNTRDALLNKLSENFYAKKNGSAQDKAECAQLMKHLEGQRDSFKEKAVKEFFQSMITAYNSYQPKK